MEVNSIFNISSSGEKFKGCALIKSIQNAIGGNDSPYFNVTLSEKEKSISSKIWESGFGGLSVVEIKNTLKPGLIVYVEGNVSEFRGELQLTIRSFRLADESEADITDYLESAPEPLESMQMEYEQYLDSINSPVLNHICREIYEEHLDSFVTHPAAKSNHHSFRSGLLYHSLSMLRLAKGICNQYPQINRDIVYAAIALHDLGKVIELTDYFAPDYTKIGNLLGHITIVNMFIDRKMQDLKEQPDKWSKDDIRLIYELMHVVSAHHGKLEYGSPVVPKTLEAEVVHQIDMIDSRINMITRGLSGVEDNNEPTKIFPLGYFFKTSEMDN